MTHTRSVQACSESGLVRGLVKSTTLWSPPYPVWGRADGWKVGVRRQVFTPALFSQIQSGVMTLSHLCFPSSLSY